MIAVLSMEIDDRTAEKLDAVWQRYGADCASEAAISEFLAGVGLTAFARQAARDLLTERQRGGILGAVNR